MSGTHCLGDQLSVDVLYLCRCRMSILFLSFSDQLFTDDTIPTDVEQATGLEKHEVDQLMAGKLVGLPSFDLLWWRAEGTGSGKESFPSLPSLVSSRFRIHSTWSQSELPGGLRKNPILSLALRRSAWLAVYVSSLLLDCTFYHISVK